MRVDTVGLRKLQVLKAVKGSKVKAVYCTNVQKMCLRKSMPKTHFLTNERGRTRGDARSLCSLICFASLC